MPEDVIARAIAEQASRTPQELGSIVPGVLVGVGDLGLAVATEVQRLLTTSASSRLALAGLRQVVIAPPGLVAPERLDADIARIEPEWRPDKIRLRHIDEWLSPELGRSQPESLEIRQVERLAYFAAYPELRGRLQLARDKALAAVRDAAGCTFYIVAGLGEGDGSGLVFDLAHLAKQLLEDVPGGRVVGYLLLPPAPAGNEGPLARPNAYAALKELDYFNAGGELTVRYTAGTPAEVLASPLFSACYLLDGPRAGGVRDGELGATDLVAIHVHADFLTGGVGASSRAVRERLGRVARPGREDKEGCQTAYRALGAARLHIDGTRLARACGLAVAERLLSRILEVGQDDSAARLSRFATPWSPGDQPGSLIRRLGTGEGGGALEEQVQAWPGELAARIDREADPGRVRVWLEARIDELIAHLEPDAADLAQRLTANVGAAQAAFEAELDAELQDVGIAARPANWFAPALRFLEGLETRMKLHAEQAAETSSQHAEVAASCERMLAERLDEVEKAYTHPLARFGSSRRLVTERALAGLWRTLEELLAVKARRAVWAAVPAFHASARTAVAGRSAALGAAADQVAEARKRVIAAQEQVLRDGPAPGELFHPAWLGGDVNTILGGPDDVLGRLARRLLDRCGAASPVELASGGPAEDLDMRLATALRDVADEAAALVPPRSAADRFGALAQSEADQRQALVAALEAAAPRLALEARMAAELPGPEGSALLVGIPGGPANPHGDFAAILDLLLLCVDDLGLHAPISIADLPGSADQILFIREMAGFPLRSVVAIDDLAARYREWTKQPKAEPVHMAKDPGAFETIPGIFPPDERTKRRALEAFVVGVQWGVFDVENGIIVHRQKLPGMAFLDTRIIGTLDRPLRAVKYLVDHPDLVQLAHARIAELVAEAQGDPAIRQDRLGRLERYYLRILEDCRAIVTSADFTAEDDEDARDEVVKHLPLWELAEAILAFNAQHGFQAAAVPEEPAPAQPQGVPALEPLPPAAGSDDIQCRQCGSLSPARAKFCAECAAPLGRTDACPACGTIAPTGARFCIECATPLGSPAARWEASRPSL